MISLRSELRRRLLAYFLANRAARIHVRALARVLQVDSTNLSRELASLEREGLFRSEISGRHLYYSLNPDYPYLKPVLSMLQRTVGLVPLLRTRLRRVEGIEQAYLYGSFAKGQADAHSDIDILVLGKPNAAQLAMQVAAAEKILQREIGYTVFKPEELKRKLDQNDPFVSDVWNGGRTELISNGQDKAAEIG
jgi:predicted nucleotidyltransferase